MNLHKNKSEFRQLISIVAAEKHLPESAVERDYYIVLLLKNLEDSTYICKRKLTSRTHKILEEFLLFLKFCYFFTIFNAS